MHLHYSHPLGRLTEVKRIVGDQALETLVTYRYDDNGQLSQVSNRNGDTLRYFSYTDGIMTRHSTALGLACEALVHYNADRRVTASRDFGGKEYAINLDDFGNIVGVALPDGNQLTLNTTSTRA